MRIDPTTNVITSQCVRWDAYNTQTYVTDGNAEWQCGGSTKDYSLAANSTLITNNKMATYSNYGNELQFKADAEL